MLGLTELNFNYIRVCDRDAQDTMSIFVLMEFNVSFSLRCVYLIIDYLMSDCSA